LKRIRRQDLELYCRQTNTQRQKHNLSGVNNNTNIYKVRLINGLGEFEDFQQQ